jgi:MFS family permease
MEKLTVTDPEAKRPGWLNPASKFYRYLVLAFIASLSFGCYFAYDIVSAIAPSLIEELQAARQTVGTFFTMYSLAAVLAVLIGGVLVDKLGTRKSSLLFSCLVLVGAIIVWKARSIPVFFLGRFIFGAGSEPLIVAQSAMLARWFRSKELALSFGVTLTISRLGSLFAFNTGELISRYFGGFRFALLAAVLACGLSLLGNILYALLDKRGEKVLSLKNESVAEKINLKEVKNFKPTFWYTTALCFTFYSAIFPFTALSTDFFVDKWGIARTAESSGGFLAQVFNNFLHLFSTAGGISSIIIFASMIFAPLAGGLIDRLGRRASLMVLGSLVLIPCHLLMGLTSIYPAYPMIFLGLAFVLVPAALWPSVPLVVKEEWTGTAFGLMTAIQNVGLGLFPLLNGFLRDRTHSYTASSLMFASLGLIGLIFSYLLKKADSREGGRLEAARPKA